MMTLGEKIKLLRSEKKLSQNDLEKKCGINSKLLSKYENGRITPTADTLRKIAQGLNITSDYLIFDNVPKNGISQLKDLELFEMFKEVESLDLENKKMVKLLIDAVLIKKRVMEAIKAPAEEPWETRMRKTLAELRRGAEEYSEAEIMQIVDGAVKAVRLEERKAS